VEQLSREIVGRLLWRPEDTPERLEHNIEQYNTKVLQVVEVEDALYTSVGCGYVVAAAAASLFNFEHTLLLQ